MRYLYTFIIAVLSMSLPMLAQADAAVLLKGGTVDLRDTDQLLDSSVRNFNESSYKGFGVSWEARKQKGLAVGVEYFNYRHKYNPPATGRAKTQFINFTAKKYFDLKVVHPYLGFGFGPTHTSVSGGANIDPEINLGMQGIAGIELRTEGMGFFVEAKRIYSDTDGDVINEYDPTATAYVAGVSLLF